MAIKGKDDRDEFMDAVAFEEMNDLLNGREPDSETDEWSLMGEFKPYKKKKKRPREK